MSGASVSFRARGGAWVLAQFALMALIGAAWFVPPRWPESIDFALDIVGVLLAIGGAALVVAASLALGRTLTPLPEPRPSGTLQTDGAYALVRHPIYGGGLLFFAGLSLALTVPSFVLTIVLGALWLAKSRDEERRLARVYPEYESYRLDTPRRLIPFLL